MIIAELFGLLGLQVDKKSFDSGERLINGIKGALVGLIAMKTVHWAEGLIESTVQLGGKLNDLSQTIGVPASALQELGYAASQNSSSLEGMATGLRFLSRNMNAAAEGSKEAKKMFKDMGVEFKNSDGTLRAPEDVLGDIGDHLASLPDGAKKTALAMQVFGRAGAELIPTLNKGNAGLDEARKNFRDLGGGISDEAVVALDEFGDAQDDLKVSMTSLKNEAVIALLPFLKSTIKTFIDWVKVNRKLIGQKIVQLVKGLVSVFQALGAFMEKFVLPVFVFFSDHLLLTKVIVGALAAAFVLLQLKSVAAGLGSAAAWVIGLLPILAIIAGIAILILIIQDLYSWFSGGDSVLKELYESFVKWLGESTIGKVLGGIKAAFQATFEWIGGVIKTIGGVIAGIFDAIEAAADALGSVLEGVVGVDAEGNMTLDPRVREQNKKDAAAKAGMRVDESGKLRPAFTGPSGAFASDFAPSAPVAAGPGVNVSAPQLQNNISVTVPPGSDASAIGTKIREAMEDFWEQKIIGTMIDGEDKD